jgi:hypothetical protein
MTWSADDALPDLEALSVPELIQLQRLTLYALREREVVSTLDNLTGGLAETLVSIAYNGELAANSQKGYDVMAGTKRLQVKARALPYPKVGSNTTGKIGPGHYDTMIVVLFKPEDLSVVMASELTPEVVEARKTSKDRLVPNRVLMEKLGTPRTERLQAAARELYNWPDVRPVRL